MPKTDNSHQRIETTQQIKHFLSVGLFLSVGIIVFNLSAIVPASLFHRPHEQNTGQRIVVRAQDSISYLALRQYGFYSDSLLAILKHANGHIPDWQNLQPGETIEFPALPASAPRIETLRSEAALAVLTFMEGDVKCLRGLSRQYQPAKLNLILRPGDEILTAKNGRAELVLDQRSVLRLEANSRLRIIRLHRDQQAQGSYQGAFDLMVGALWARIARIMDRTPKVDVQFPTAIAGVQGTSYRARVEADSSTNVRVYEGSVEVRSRPAGPPQQIGPPQRVPGPRQISLEAWVKSVRAQQEINIARNGRPGEPQTFTDQGAEAAWVGWNQARDRDLNAGR
ncbi:MAG: FecR family protein [bacterium]